VVGERLGQQLDLPRRGAEPDRDAVVELGVGFSWMVASGSLIPAGCARSSSSVIPLGSS